MSLHYGNRKFWLISALALLLLLLLWTWFQRNFERRSIQVETGWSAAARRNPYLAAERFCKAQVFRPTAHRAMAGCKTYPQQAICW
jgi:hypothetical protein